MNFLRMDFSSANELGPRTIPLLGVCVMSIITSLPLFRVYSCLDIISKLDLSFLPRYGNINLLSLRDENQGSVSEPAEGLNYGQLLDNIGHR